MATSQNGYTAAETPSKLPGGTKRIIPKGAPESAFVVRAGDVATVFQYLVDQYQARVEDIDLYTKGSGDDWGYASRPIRGQSSGLSNHASGTAIDINATRHPLATSPSSNFSSKQISAIHAILKELRGAVRWGGDYSGRKDPMHFEINVGSSTLKKVAADIKSGKIHGPGAAHETPAPLPKPPAAKTLLSFSAVQNALKKSEQLVDGWDGKQYKILLNRFMGSKLTEDNSLGEGTRKTTAAAQLKIARANGNTSLGEKDCWPNKGYHSDLDGIPGNETFAVLGAVNSDKVVTK